MSTMIILVVLLGISSFAFGEDTCGSSWTVRDQQYCPSFKGKDENSAVLATDGVKVELTAAMKNTGATCLDGSVPVMYYRAAQDNAATNKWHVYLEGGGACVGFTQAMGACFDSCEHRAGTDLGSSKGYPTHANFDSGYMSTNSRTNPLAYDWNTVYVKYCDGGCYLGSNATTVKVGKYDLHFRGNRNIHGVFQTLIDDYKFGAATDVLFSGCSAGGGGVYAHTQMVATTYVPSGANFLSMPDSGFFPEVEERSDFEDSVRWMYDNMNTTASMNAQCLADNAKDHFQCDFPQNIVQYITAPMFALQSRFDAWQTACIMESVNPGKINEYGDSFTDTFLNAMMNEGPYKAMHGAFLDSCHHHCGQWNDMHVNGMDQSQAETQFYAKHAGADQHLWFQNETYPCASCCHD